MNVAAHNGVEPYGAVVSHFHVAYDDGAFAEVAVSPKARGGHA